MPSWSDWVGSCYSYIMVSAMRLADLTGRAAAMTIWSGWAGSCYASLIWLVWKLLCLAGLAGREGVVHLGQKLSGIGGARSAQQDLNVIKLLSNDGDPNPIGIGLFCRLRKFYHKIQFDALKMDAWLINPVSTILDIKNIHFFDVPVCL